MRDELLPRVVPKQFSGLLLDSLIEVLFFLRSDTELLHVIYSNEEHGVIVDVYSHIAILVDIYQVLIDDFCVAGCWLHIAPVGSHRSVNETVFLTVSLTLQVIQHLVYPLLYR